MRRFITLLLLLVLLGAANRSSAQFSISRVTPKEIDTKAMDDTIKPIAPINNRFFSEARYKAERRAIRKERNTVQINASAMFNLTGFENWYAGATTFSPRTWHSISRIHTLKASSISKRLSTPVTASTASAEKTLKTRTLSSST